jgi:hypothetical protein
MTNGEGDRGAYRRWYGRLAGEAFLPIAHGLAKRMPEARQSMLSRVRN